MNKHEQVRQVTADSAALYYGEYYMERVGETVAYCAAEESNNQYNKWWLQKFDSGVISSIVDAYVVPRYNALQ